MKRIDSTPYRHRTMLVALCLGLAGCGDDRLGTIGGTVTHNGEPLATGRVIFEPELGRQAIGQIEEGRIVNVTTLKPGDGALVGSHRVAVFSFVRRPQKMEIVPSAIPVKYNDPATSGLKVEVTAGVNNFDLKLTD